MTKLCFILFSMFAILSCDKPGNVMIDVHVEGILPDVQPVITIGDDIYDLVLDSNGMVTLNLPTVPAPVYGVFKYGRVRIPVYVEAGKSFELYVSLREDSEGTEFRGAGAAKNEYLNSRDIQRRQADFTLEELAFIKSIQQEQERRCAYLDSLGFDREFSDAEKIRLNYNTIIPIAWYPTYHPWSVKIENYRPSDEFYSYIKSLIIEDESLLKYTEYKNAMAELISAYSLKDLPEYDALTFIKTQLSYVKDSVANPKIAEFLVDRYAWGFVSGTGVDNLADISSVYNAKVTDPGLKSKFDELCRKWQKVAKGQPSPDFSYFDIDSNRVSLADLAGKYVYIDIWATWCNPCKSELPYLKQLYQQFKKDNIHFVSISCDKDHDAWVQMVKEEQLGGIQLHNGGDKSFMDTYLVRGIPRFILLDREGRVVSADMTRPSNPKTVEMLTALEGI